MDSNSQARRFWHHREAAYRESEPTFKEGAFVDWSRDISRAVYKHLESSTDNETQDGQANHDAENLANANRHSLHLMFYVRNLI
jgi:hypothetical protein